MNSHHQRRNCPCCECGQHRECIPVLCPRWTCLMPKRLNEILVGPLHLRSDCILEVKESNQTSFKIVDKYIHPNFFTQMITLSVIVPSFLIIKPGELLASLCTVLIEDVDMNITENTGK